MATIYGHWDPIFSKVPEIFQTLIDSGEEIGASITVNIKGRTVLDIWGGYADPEKTTLWQEDTIANVFSTTKIIVSLAALILVDRSLLDLNARVSQYWPEFAANGKQDVLVRHVLGHTSGVSGWYEQLDVTDICELETSTARLAAQSPLWEPGTAGGYHVWTQGHLIGELVRRVTGRSLKEFIAEEVAGPLGADFQLGALEKDWGRISDVIAPPDEGPPPFGFESIPGRSLLNPRWTIPFIWTSAWRCAEIGAANGHGNARAVARIISMVSNGGLVDGKRMLSQETVDLIFEEQARNIDLVTGEAIRRGLGCALVGTSDTFVDEWMPSGRVCFWGGLGGSMGIMDVERGITIAYVMNKMGLGNEAVKKYVKAIYEAVGVKVGPVGR